MLSSPGTSLPASTRLRVLLVDDDLLVLRATHRMLRRELDVVMAESAEAALGLFHQGQRFDVVLSDLNLPGIPGLALIELLARQWPAASGHIGVLSGRSLSADEARRIDALPVTVMVLEKPIPKAELLRRLHGLALAA